MLCPPSLLSWYGLVADPKVRISVVATTSRPNVLDPALRRAGRLDKEIEVRKTPKLFICLFVYSRFICVLPAFFHPRSCSIKGEQKGDIRAVPEQIAPQPPA